MTDQTSDSAVLERALDFRRHLFGTTDSTLLDMGDLAAELSRQGDWARAFAWWQQILDLYLSRYGRGDDRTVAARTNLAFSMLAVGRLESAITMLQEALSDQLSRPARGVVRTTEIMAYLSDVLRAAGRTKEADSLRVQVEEKVSEIPLAERPFTLTGTWLTSVGPFLEIHSNDSSLGSSLTERTNCAIADSREQALDELRKAEAELFALRQHRFGDADPRTIRTAIDLANTFEAQGEPKEAESIFAMAVNELDREHGHLSHQVATALTNRALGLRLANRFVEEVELRREILHIDTIVLGRAHDSTVASELRLARALLTVDRPKEALELFWSVLASWASMSIQNRTALVTEIEDFARTLASGSHHAKLVQVRREIRKTYLATLGSTDDRVLDADLNLALALLETGNPTEAVELAIRAYTERTHVLPDSDPRILRALEVIAYSYWAIPNIQAARAYFEDLVGLRQRVLGFNHPETIEAMDDLGAALHRLGEYSEAFRVNSRALILKSDLFGETHAKTIRTRSTLASNLLCDGEFSQAKDVIEFNYSVAGEYLGADDPETLFAATIYASALASSGELLEARTLLEQNLALVTPSSISPDHAAVQYLQSALREVQQKISEENLS